MFNMFMASRQAALESLVRLQSLGIRDEEIVGMASLIDLDKLGKKWQWDGDDNGG